MLCAAVLLAVGTSVPAAAPPHVDRIFVNGRIWTGDDAEPSAEALAIGGDKIVAVGSTADIRALAASDTVVVDLHGCRVVPGFNDAHLHFPGPSVNVIALAGADSLAELQRRIADYAKAHPTNRWVIGRGWGYSAFPNGKPDKKVPGRRRPRPAGVHPRARRPHGAGQLAGARPRGHHAGHA